MLDGEKPASISSKDRHSRASGRARAAERGEAAVGHRENRKGKIGFRLAAACGKPEKITDVAIAMNAVYQRRDVDELKRKLEWPPGIDLPVLGPARLDGDGVVGEAESETRIVVGDKKLDSDL